MVHSEKKAREKKEKAEAAAKAKEEAAKLKEEQKQLKAEAKRKAKEESSSSGRKRLSMPSLRGAGKNPFRRTSAPMPERVPSEDLWL